MSKKATSQKRQGRKPAKPKLKLTPEQEHKITCDHLANGGFIRPAEWKKMPDNERDAISAEMKRRGLVLITRFSPWQRCQVMIAIPEKLIGQPVRFSDYSPPFEFTAYQDRRLADGENVSIVVANVSTYAEAKRAVLRFLKEVGELGAECE